MSPDPEEADGYEVKGEEHPVRAQYEEDRELVMFDNRALFTEYQEIVIQFGFLTMFACVLPIAPIFALINNILEIR